jgi:hypothetical protein
MTVATKPNTDSEFKAQRMALLSVNLLDIIFSYDLYYFTICTCVFSRHLESCNIDIVNYRPTFESPSQ